MYRLRKKAFTCAGLCLFLSACAGTATQTGLNEPAYTDPKIKVSFADSAWTPRPSGIWNEFKCNAAKCQPGSVVRWLLRQSAPGERQRILDGELNEAYVETKGRRIAQEKRVKYVYSKPQKSAAYTGYDIMLQRGASFSGMNYRLVRILLNDDSVLSLTSQSNSREQTEKNMEALFRTVKISK